MNDFKEFSDADLGGSQFTRVDLSGSSFEQVDLTGVRMRNVYLAGARLRGADLTDLELDGMVRNLIVNGVDVTPFVEAELDRRYPERVKLRPTDADGFREAWRVIEASWPPTVALAQTLPPDALHERVDGEWSFIETLRHLVFVVDAWAKRAVLHDPSPYDALGLPHDEHDPNDHDVPNDRSARPTLEQLLELRNDRTAVVRKLLADLTDEQLAGETHLSGPGYPTPGRYPVRRCLQAVVNEEWEHRLIAERDLRGLRSRR
ncbi:DinB family protein [Allobranchiibius sp. CTAmp26]|uniref:DinB family protein n=1 Tax=Allobranchiibius sp. CTAmp26 TaxID=2815214 RepID=UPI001AA1953E|nr:DinB family protein [Allobranchiibius sp. CTAmp26]MBO1756331.1 DinB family protein [Allobranchiibius sp. CTAmp26]